MGDLRARTDQRDGGSDTRLCADVDTTLVADVVDEADYRLTALARGLTTQTGGRGDVEDLVNDALALRDVCIIGGVDGAARMAATLADRIVGLAGAPSPDGPELVATLVSAVDTFELLGLGGGGPDLARPPTEDAGALPPAAPAGTRPTVLLVDGVMTLREQEREVLERAGYAVRTAGDGPGALDTLRCSPVDVVVADAEMPGMSGIELTRAIRRAPGLEHVPVIVIARRVTEEVRRLSADAGADGLVLKSAFASRELLGAVARVIDPPRWPRTRREPVTKDPDPDGRGQR